MSYVNCTLHLTVLYRGLRADMGQFVELLNHFFGETISIIMEEE
jgi:hypothetical protein